MKRLKNMHVHAWVTTVTCLSEVRTRKSFKQNSGATLVPWQIFSKLNQGVHDLMLFLSDLHKAAGCLATLAVTLSLTQTFLSDWRSRAAWRSGDATGQSRRHLLYSNQ